MAIYPHANNYCETIDHSVKIAKLVDRNNFGIIFNICHLLKVEGERGWDNRFLSAMPYIYMISLNGADRWDTQEMGWDKLIQPLGEGSLIHNKVVKFAKDNGYDGPSIKFN